jgi:AraC family transcriptional regulator
MNVTILERPAMRLAAVVHTGPYDGLGKAFQRLHELASPALAASAIEMLAVYHADPRSTPAPELRSEAALAVPEGIAIPEGLVEMRLPAGRFAHATHLGPYDKLAETWEKLEAWLLANGHVPTKGTSHEVYRNTPMIAPPEELRTDLYLPIHGSR